MFRSEKEHEWVREWDHSTPSPLSQEGQFPPFTGVPLSGTGRPRCKCLVGGIRGSHRGRGSRFKKVDQAESFEVFASEPPVVRPTFALELHAADSHANPAVQAAKAVVDMGERSREVIRDAAYHRVDFPDDFLVQVVMPWREFSDPVLEFL